MRGVHYNLCFYLKDGDIALYNDLDIHLLIKTIQLLMYDEYNIHHTSYKLNETIIYNMLSGRYYNKLFSNFFVIKRLY
jgi:hypothetical protein